MTEKTVRITVTLAELETLIDGLLGYASEYETMAYECEAFRELARRLETIQANAKR